MQCQRSGEVERALGEWLKAGERARDLVNRIFSSCRKGPKLGIRVDLGDLVRELRLSESILPSTIEIRCDLSEPCTVMADPAQIHQVVMNLCSNAAHAMEKSGGVIEVSLVRVPAEEAAAASGQDIVPGSYAKLSVRDTGHGISPEVMEHIFDPYFTTKEMGRGTGLGLAVAHGVVKSHGGSITCSSVSGGATTFDVFLPAIASRGDGAPAGKPDHVPTGTERILFVDDDPVLAALAAEILGELGYRAVAKTSSTEALSLFSKDPAGFDLVITDMTMPGMTGDMLASELMRIRRDVPIISARIQRKTFQRKTPGSWASASTSFEAARPGHAGRLRPEGARPGLMPSRSSRRWNCGVFPLQARQELRAQSLS